MKLSEVYPQQPKVDLVDFSDLSATMRHMQELAVAINEEARNVADARAIKECHGDRMKRALALEMRQMLLDGESASKAEALARSSDRYGKALANLQADLTAAETFIEQANARRTAFDAARSAVAALRHAAETY